MQVTKKTNVSGKKSKPRVSNQVRVDAKDPIPFGNDLAFSYFNQSRYLPFLPPKDGFAYSLLEARLLSVTNNACITTKKDYCKGEGFQDVNGTELAPEVLDWFGMMNLNGDSLTDVNASIFEDHFTYGNTPIELVRFTVAKKNHLMVIPQDFLEWRLGPPNDNDICDYAIQSKLFRRKDFNLIMTSDIIKKSKKLPIYNPLLPNSKKNWYYDADTDSYRTLLWYKNRVTGFPYYGLPSNIASLICQLLEYKGGRFNLDMFENNMVPAAVMALKGQVGTDEAIRIGKQLVNTYSGDGKRGRTVVVASEEGIDGSDFHQLDTKKDGSYIEGDNLWTQKIILANQWDSILAGLVSPSTFGKGSGFITKIEEIKLKTVIKPAQKDLMNKVWSIIFKIAEPWLSLPFSKYQLEFKNSIDISGLTDVDVTPAVQVNEVRKAKGLQEDPAKKGVYMKAAAPEPSANPKKGGKNVPNQ